ncbi:hypothetical protein [Sediminimonas sp.]|uniref:hypothetical protein n=1 Tax=Sediminimonas sp. TaxID=2823379 RepID=UPI0025E87BAC|nr:hypothetical protein [Sediminimonas sp.]
MQISEQEIRDGALIALSASKSGRLTTTELIDILEKEMNPTGHDAELADNRSDTYFSQKVRNLVSHRNDGQGLESNGYAVYDSDYEGWEITESGKKRVQSFRS